MGRLHASAFGAAISCLLKIPRLAVPPLSHRNLVRFATSGSEMLVVPDGALLVCQGQVILLNNGFFQAEMS